MQNCYYFFYCQFLSFKTFTCERQLGLAKNVQCTSKASKYTPLISKFWIKLWLKTSQNCCFYSFSNSGLYTQSITTSSNLFRNLIWSIDKSFTTLHCYLPRKSWRRVFLCAWYYRTQSKFQGHMTHTDHVINSFWQAPLQKMTVLGYFSNFDNSFDTDSLLMKLCKPLYNTSNQLPKTFDYVILLWMYFTD